MFGRSQVHEELTVIKSQRETNSLSVPLLPAVKHPICTFKILCIIQDSGMRVLVTP